MFNISEHFSNYVRSYTTPNIASNIDQAPVVTLVVVGIWVSSSDIVEQIQFPKLS